MHNQGALLSGSEQKMFAQKVHNEMQVPADIAVSLVVAVLDIAEEEERILSKEQVFDLACCFARLNQAKELMKRYLSSSLGVVQLSTISPRSTRHTTMVI